MLADISGFTAFVTRTELEHGPPIIAELLEAVIHRLAPPLQIQEVEGDATPSRRVVVSSPPTSAAAVAPAGASAISI